MIYLQLILSFLQVGLFSFGGGYASIALIEEQVVSTHHWLSLQEFNDLITISQMTPGPVALNSATFVGTKIAGLPGAITATLACILPSCIIVGLISYFYFKYKNLSIIQTILKALRPAVIALIACAGLLIISSSFFPDGSTFKLTSLINFCLALFLLRKYKWNPILVMVISGLCEVGFYYIF